jgi:hypothetical protein
VAAVAHGDAGGTGRGPPRIPWAAGPCEPPRAEIETLCAGASPASGWGILCLGVISWDGEASR